jgi:hypothetical protein
MPDAVQNFVIYYNTLVSASMDVHVWHASTYVDLRQRLLAAETVLRTVVLGRDVGGDGGAAARDALPALRQLQPQCQLGGAAQHLDCRGHHQAVRARALGTARALSIVKCAIQACACSVYLKARPTCIAMHLK